ncbi:NUDIX hydrolase [Roseococcus sp. DSY-14]|uniref:NUDIX hydrolase n=1 Tax=Roseococcus sp. DSY-14 TaxID=3369650 RepID=UPI00387B1448
MDKPAPAIPRPAATLMLLRDGPAGLEVLLVARTREVDFAAGALVFPGGRVEEADGVLAAAEDALGAFRITAIREAWEEIGILLARPPAPPVEVATPFGAELRARGLRPEPERLVHFAHWVTPEHAPKRFDTHFFAALAPEGQEALHDGREAVECAWLRPQDALDQAGQGRWNMVFPTRLNLQRLARFASAAEALDAAARTPVVTVMPVPRPDGQGGTNLHIPEAAGYGGGIFPAVDRSSTGLPWPGQVS